MDQGLWLFWGDVIFKPAIICSPSCHSKTSMTFFILWNAKYNILYNLQFFFSIQWKCVVTSLSSSKKGKMQQKSTIKVVHINLALYSYVFKSNMIYVKNPIQFRLLSFWRNTPLFMSLFYNAHRVKNVEVLPFLNSFSRSFRSTFSLA